MSKRFIVEDKNIVKKENLIEISGEQVNHIKALRHEIGENINVNNYLVKLQKIDKDKIYGEVLDKACEVGVPNKNITLIQSYLKSDKMEYVVQKAVELGASSIQPVLSKNTVVKLDEKDMIKKQERLNKIAVEAVGQCGRTDMVSVLPIKRLCDIDLSFFDLVILCHEKAVNSINGIEKYIGDVYKIAILIGPEGGFDDNEVDNMSKGKNVVSIVFGKRILRAETASVYMLSILDYLSNI